MKTTQAVYDFIVWAFRETGMPPTIRQIGAGVGLKSSNSVHKQLRKLVMMQLIVMVNRHPLPCSILEYLKLFNVPSTQIVKESYEKSYSVGR